MPKKKWFKNNIAAEAKKYTRRQKFKKGSPGAYKAARLQNILDEVCSHMGSDFWTKEKLLKVSQKYKSLKTFMSEQKGAYLYSIKNGYKDEITKHMTREIKPRGFWTKANCQNEARKFSNRTDFMRKSSGAYNSSLENGWIDEICSYMGSPADGYHHCVYAIINKKRNSAYIGVTKQLFNKRIKQHKSSDNTSNSKSISLLKDTEFLKLTNYEFKKKDIKKSETYWVNFYESKGFVILNDKKQLGRTGTSQRIYTDEIILREAKKYTKRVDFRNKSPKIYDAAISQRLLDKACSHMRGIAKKNTWTKENCIAYAKQCSTKKEFRENNGAYFACMRNKWLDEVYSYI
mgnify:FL=1|tara:strand:+ start:1855 stop:2892 length:1038 start_codon:yes stop_codon:yes gene_type:complete